MSMMSCFTTAPPARPQNWSGVGPLRLHTDFPGPAASMLPPSRACNGKRLRSSSRRPARTQLPSPRRVAHVGPARVRTVTICQGPRSIRPAFADSGSNEGVPPSRPARSTIRSDRVGAPHATRTDRASPLAFTRRSSASPSPQGSIADTSTCGSSTATSRAPSTIAPAASSDTREGKGRKAKPCASAVRRGSSSRCSPKRNLDPMPPETLRARRRQPRPRRSGPRAQVRARKPSHGAQHRQRQRAAPIGLRYRPRPPRHRDSPP